MRLPPLSACALLAASSAPASQIVRDVVETSLVPSPVEYAALLPDGYDGQGEPLPLLLMLHGSSRDREEIARRQPQIERLWREGGLPEMVVATPSVPAGTIYLDSYDGSAQWETFLMKEFLPYLRQRFHAGRERKTTMVTGISMGGLGGLRLAFKYPETFGAVAAMEPGVWPGLYWDETPAQNKIRRAASRANLFGDPFDELRWQAANPASIAAADPARLKDLAIYFECGDEDGLGFQGGNEFLHRTLWRLRIPHEYRLVRWADHIGGSLEERSLNRFRFLARYLEQPVAPEPAVTQFRANRAERLKEMGFKPFPYWPSDAQRLDADGERRDDRQDAIVYWPSDAGSNAASLLRRADELRRARGVARIADLPYDRKPGVAPERLSLDVYTQDDLKGAPVILFAHGGGWVRGGKRSALFKPARFVPAGYLFASMNYRFRPDATLVEMAQDVAAAAAWLKRNADKYGGDGGKIFLMGHSAGAHLVAAVGTNEVFLEKAGASLHDLAGVIPLDTIMYNVPPQMKTAGRVHREAFGSDPAHWAPVSPWRHVARGKGIPPFLLLISDGRREAAVQPIPFAARLQAAGVEAEWFEAEGRGHGPLNAYLGVPGDESTERVLQFLERNSR